MKQIWMRMKEKQIQETGIMAVFALASGWLLASLLMQSGEDSRFFALSAIAEIGTGKLVVFSLLYGTMIFAIGYFLKRKWIPTACFTAGTDPDGRQKILSVLRNRRGFMGGTDRKPRCTALFGSAYAVF